MAAMAMSSAIYAAVDLGAGSGAKLALMADPHIILIEDLLLRSDYGATCEALADALADRIEKMLRRMNLTLSDLRAAGIASPGLFARDGGYLLAANLEFLNGTNLKHSLGARLGKPTAIDNDANAGGLAEWSAVRTELLYWVLGGGWGGAWISRYGDVKYPALDWDGDDDTLHPTNEPGYATGLPRRLLAGLFRQARVSFRTFDQVLQADLKPPGGEVLGPGGRKDLLRAEAVLSGPGRFRIFRAVTVEDDSCRPHLSEAEQVQLQDPATAGSPISKLSRLRVRAGLVTDRLFGRILAEATAIILERALADGCREGVPIFLGGKPSYALPYFGPSAQRALGRKGIGSYLRPSIIDERGANANLAGAAVLAQKAEQLEL